MKIAYALLPLLAAVHAAPLATVDHTARSGTADLESTLRETGVPDDALAGVLDTVTGLLKPLLSLTEGLPLPVRRDTPDLGVEDLPKALEAAGVPTDIISQVVDAIKKLLQDLLGPLGDLTGGLPVPLPVRRDVTADLESTLKVAGVPTDIIGNVVDAIKKLLKDLLGPLGDVTGGLPLPLPIRRDATADLESTLKVAGVPTDLIGSVVDAIKKLLQDLLGPLGDVTGGLPLPLPIRRDTAPDLESTLKVAGVPTDIISNVVEAIKKLLTDLLGPLTDVAGGLPLPGLPIRRADTPAGLDGLESALTAAGVPADVLGKVVEAIKKLLGELLGPLSDLVGGLPGLPSLPLPDLPVPGLPVRDTSGSDSELNVKLTTELQNLGLDGDLVGEIVGAVNNLLGGALGQLLAGFGGGLPLGIPEHIFPQ